LAGSDNAYTGDAMGGLHLIGFADQFLVEARDSKKPICGENLFEHFTIAWLKDVQRHERLGKKRHGGQRHDRHLIGQSDFHFHARTVRWIGAKFNRSSRDTLDQRSAGSA
jgi:hypothetical protein